MQAIVKKLMSTRLGRSIYLPAQALVHFSRRLRYPGVPVEYAVTRVSYRQRNFSIVHRRWDNINDTLAVEQCFSQAQYDLPSGAHGIHIDQVYREIVASGKSPLIVDCGANIGASVLWFTARYPKAHIVAIEPAPQNFIFLARNCAGLNVDLRQAGIGPVDGTAWLSGADDGGMGCRTYASEEGLRIEVISLASILAEKTASRYTPFLLKVDIEGAEKSLFSGPASTLDQFPLIIMEPHDWMFPGQQTSVEFFRFHSQAGREFAMNHENIASIACHPSLLSSFGKGGL